MLPGFGAKIGMLTPLGYEADYLDTFGSTMNGGNNIATATGENIGDADATRRIFANVYWGEGGSHVSLSSMTIGGVSATIHGQGGHTGGISGFGVAIVSAIVPTGTTANFVALFSAAISGSAAFAAFRTVRLEDSSPFDSASTLSVGTSTSLSTSINIPEGGLIIGAFNYSVNADNTVTWTGATEITDRVGFSKNLAAETNRSFGITASTQGDSGNHLLGVSWK